MGTYGALDGSERQHVLGSVAAVSTPGLVAGVVSLLQDKLLSLELGVLITHPTRQRKDAEERERRKKRIEMFRLGEIIKTKTREAPKYSHKVILNH